MPLTNSISLSIQQLRREIQVPCPKYLKNAKASKLLSLLSFYHLENREKLENEIDTVSSSDFN